MADAEVTFALNLEGNLGEAARDDAAALEELKAGLVEDTARLREMQRAMGALKGSTTANVETVKQLKDRIAASKAAIAGKTEKLVGMKGAFDKVKPAARGTAASLSDVMKVAQGSSGPLSGIATRLGAIKGLLAAGVIAGGIIAITAALAALAAVSAGVIASLTLYAIKQADARRSDLLRLEGLSKHRNFWLEMVTGHRRAANSADFLQQSIDRVAAKTPVARERIADMTSELYKAGLRSGNLQHALEAMAIVESTQGQEAAAAFKARALSAHLYGSSIKRVSDDIKTRLGGVAKAQMISLDVQQRKTRESISLLFKDVKITPFLEAVSKLTEMFSQTTASGRALKAIIDALVQPLIDGIGKAGPLAKRFFQGMIIAALQLTIVVLKVRNVLRATFGGSELLKNIDLTTIALNAGIFAFSMLASAVVVSVAAVGAFVGGIVAAGAAIYLLVKPWIDAVGVMIGVGAKLVAWVHETPWHELGLMIARGIAGGLFGGVGLVGDAMVKLGDSAIAAFRKKMGIASPSKLAERTTDAVPQGQVRSLERGRPMVARSAERLGAAVEAGLRAGGPSGAAAAPARAPSAIAAGAPARATSPQRGAPSFAFTFENGAIQIGGATPEPQLKQRLQEAVEEIFERVAINLAAPLGATS